MADYKVESPEELIKVGGEIEVKVLRVDVEERKVGLSRKQGSWTENQAGEAAIAAGTGGGGPRRRELRGGTGSDTSCLFISSIPE